ncbi:MAG: hypothetical protein Q9212_004628 [Teloschistes hypoglaucus]
MAEIARLPANFGRGLLLEWCERPQESMLSLMPTLPIAAKTPSEDRHHPAGPKRFKLWMRFTNG